MWPLWVKITSEDLDTDEDHYDHDDHDDHYDYCNNDDHDDHDDHVDPDFTDVTLVYHFYQDRSGGHKGKHQDVRFIFIFLLSFLF